MTVLSLLLSCLGWALLSLGLPRHYQALFAGTPSSRRMRTLRAGGWMLLIASLLPALSAHGIPQGWAYWGASLVLGAIAWVLLLAWRSPAQRREARATAQDQG